jgi:hypothetical protein
MNCLTDLVESIGVNRMILTEHAYISISISISFVVIRYCKGYFCFSEYFIAFLLYSWC